MPERAGDILDMDAVEHLAGLHQPPRSAFGEVDEGIAARAVDAGEPEHGDRHAALAAVLDPGLLGREAQLRAAGRRTGFARLVDPGALVVAIDADGREISDPSERR